MDVYAIYSDDIAGAPPREHIFGFDPTCTDGSGEGSFDLRDVTSLLSAPARDGDARTLLTALIDAGYLTPDGFVIGSVLVTSIREIAGAVARCVHARKGER